MTPSRPRMSLWPFAALPAGAFASFVAAAAGFAQERPSSSLPPAEIKSSPTTGSEPTNPKSGRYGAPVATFPDSRPRIAYGLRWLFPLDAERWRDRFDSRLRLITQEAEVTAWIIDEQAYHDLVVYTAEDPEARILNFATVTAVEKDTATISLNRKVPYVARVEKLDNPKAVHFRPIIKEIEDGWRLNMSGSLLSAGTRISVDLRDSWLLGFHKLARTDRADGQELRNEFQVPNTIARRCQVSTDIPEGSSLVVSLGIRFDTDVDAPLAGQRINANRKPHERLFVITPQKVVGETLGIPEVELGKD